MYTHFFLKHLAACALLSGTGMALAHVTLPPGGGTAGGDYEAAFRVGHACRAPEHHRHHRALAQGFGFTDAQARKGWKLDIQKPTGDGGGEVRWTAESAQTALPGNERAEFIVTGKLPPTPGALWFKVLQTCDTGSADWAQVRQAASRPKGSKARRPASTCLRRAQRRSMCETPGSEPPSRARAAPAPS